MSEQTQSSVAPEVTDTVVIGGGPAGLAMGACLLQAKVPFMILERASAVGAAWRNHYERLHLHTVKQHSSLPFLPFGNHVPKYVPRAQVVEYLDAYALRFGLELCLNHEVKRVNREGDVWITVCEHQTFHSKRVVIATGYNRKPVVPSWPGQDAFTGVILHSAAYRSGAAYRGQRVLVVGFGNTGAEIALDLVEHGATVTQCVRGPVHVVPREALGSPTQVTGIMLEKLPVGLADLISNTLTRIIVGDLSRYGLTRPAKSPFHQISADGRVPVIDVGTIAKIKDGTIKVVPGIQRFDGANVVFEDGTSLPFDVVVLATGYRPGLDDFLEHAKELVDERGYPRELSVESARYPGLYFLGYKNPPAGFLRQIAIDSQAIAKCIAQKHAPLETAHGRA